MYGKGSEHGYEPHLYPPPPYQQHAPPIAVGGINPPATAAFNYKPVGIFWDIENCSVPKGKSASSVIHFLRNFFVINRLNHREFDFLIACDITNLRKEIPDDISRAGGVTLAHVPMSSKNAADEKLREAMKKFVDTHGSMAPSLILISGDIDFVNDLRGFQTRLGCQIIVLHGPSASAHFKTGWNEIYAFQQFLAMMSETVVESASPSPRQPLLATPTSDTHQPTAPAYEGTDGTGQYLDGFVFVPPIHTGKGHQANNSGRGHRGNFGRGQQGNFGRGQQGNLGRGNQGNVGKGHQGNFGRGQQSGFGRGQEGNVGRSNHGNFGRCTTSRPPFREHRFRDQAHNQNKEQFQAAPKPANPDNLHTHHQSGLTPPDNAKQYHSEKRNLSTDRNNGHGQQCRQPGQYQGNKRTYPRDQGSQNVETQPSRPQTPNRISEQPQSYPGREEIILMVSGLPGKMDFRILKDLLQEQASTVFGRVKYVNNGQGFISFRRKEDADKAIEMFQGQVVYGNKLNIQRSNAIPFKSPPSVDGPKESVPGTEPAVAVVTPAPRVNNNPQQGVKLSETSLTQNLMLATAAAIQQMALEEKKRKTKNDNCVIQ